MIIFVCPEDKGHLSFKKSKYICRICGKVYPIIDGIPIFIDDPKTFQSEETQYTKKLDSPLEARKHKNKKIQKLNFYIRSRPSEILLKRGFKNKRGIDIGCGIGKNENFEHIYTHVSKNVIGVEVSLSAAKAFTENFADVPCILASQLPFEDESFDFITASGLVHHLIGQPNKIVTSFREWYRVLKNGGIFILNDPNLLFPISIIMHVPNKILQKIKPGVRRRVPYERPVLFLELNSKLKRVGFKTIHCEATTFAHWTVPQTIITIITQQEALIRKSFPFKYLGHWITVSGEK